MFSPKSSVLISILSGFGLLGIVVFTPVRSPENVDIYLDPKENLRGSTNYPEGGSLATSNIPSDQNKIADKSKLEYLDMNTQKLPLGDFLEEKEARINFGEDSPQSFRGFIGNEQSVSYLGERKYLIESTKFRMRGTLSSDSHLSDQSFLNSPASYNGAFSERRGLRKYDQFELDYKFTSNLGAYVSGSNIEIGGDRTQRQVLNQTMAGVSLHAGNFFDAKFLAGDSTIQTLNLNQSPNLNGLRQVENARRNIAGVRSLYEWQANFTPSEYFKVQTSVFNVQGETQNQSSTPEGGKVSLLIGSSNLQLNIRYNYFNSRNQTGSIFYSGFVPSQDLASLGFVFFLDKSKDYSVYVGNQMFNVFNDPYNQIRDNQGRSPSTFSASFRGKNPGLNRSTFFFNFQNQFYKDGVLLGVPGGNLNANVLNGKSFYEYATSLGLELAF